MRPVALDSQAPLLEARHNSLEGILVGALTERVVELNAQHLIDAVHFIEAGRQESFPQPAILRVACMQGCRF